MGTPLAVYLIGLGSKAGRHFICPTPNRADLEFAQVVGQLAHRYPQAETIHLVLDNLNIHQRKALTNLLGQERGGEVWDGFTVHDTPTHGSWLNQAEIEISIFTRQCLGRSRIPDLKTLRREALAWNRHMNRARTQINWQFDRKTARRKFGYKTNLSHGQRPSVLSLKFVEEIIVGIARVSAKTYATNL